MIKHTILLSVIILLALNGYSQKRPDWDKARCEFVFGGGTSNYLGDLGGGADEAKVGLQSSKDIDWGLVKPAANIAWRYRLLERVYWRANLAYCQVSGDDAQSENFARQARNLSFKSNIVEVGTMLELSLLVENRGKNYILSGGPLSNINLYCFGGISGFYFEPKAQASDGTWHKLRPLGTEGQGLISGTSKYKPISMAFPVGIGLKYFVGEQWSVGIEFGTRLTQTDYLDDASGSYYNFVQEEAAGNITAADYEPVVVEFANRSGADYATGTPYRGNPEMNDAYMFLLFNVAYTYRPYKKVFNKRGYSSSFNRAKEVQKRKDLIEKQRKIIEKHREQERKKRDKAIKRD